MVEANPSASIQEKLEELKLSGAGDVIYENMVRIMNDPKYLGTAEEEIDKMLKNAKVALS